MDHVLNDDSLPVVDHPDTFAGRFACMWCKVFSYYIRLYEKEVLASAVNVGSEVAFWEASDDSPLGRYDGAEEARRLIKQEGYHGYVHYQLNKQMSDPTGIEKVVTTCHRVVLLPLNYLALLLDANFIMWHEVGFFVGDGALSRYAERDLRPCKLRSVILWHLYEEKEHGLAEMSLMRNMGTLPWYARAYTYFVKLPVGAVLDCLYIVLNDMLLCAITLLNTPSLFPLSVLVAIVSFYYSENARLLTWTYFIRWSLPSEARVLDKMAKHPWPREPHFAQAEANREASLNRVASKGRVVEMKEPPNSCAAEARNPETTSSVLQ
eukprot:CAMPEP_0197865142 /NCGR_PEP_ID=MMETSP1438-20131217/43494_1 /TAXON_ID=1461541 /ORGANISM="Pterosperma sp., Strain CCMP1384" /LENGTH=321 /DNA_ID=CAMNT_0043483563 /DNA_START=641 /DNA_END=1606 /DNA_ORIENTATION=-